MSTQPGKSLTPESDWCHLQVTNVLCQQHHHFILKDIAQQKGAKQQIQQGFTKSWSSFAFILAKWSPHNNQCVLVCTYMYIYLYVSLLPCVSRLQFLQGGCWQTFLVLFNSWLKCFPLGHLDVIYVAWYKTSDVANQFVEFKTIGLGNKGRTWMHEKVSSTLSHLWLWTFHPQIHISKAYLGTD